MLFRKLIPNLVLALVLSFSTPLYSKDSVIKDYQGNKVVLKEIPENVVSLVPSVTEIIFAIGAGNNVRMATYHNTYPSETAKVKIAGGFFNPSADEIRKIKPELIFISDLQKEVIEKFGRGSDYVKNCRLINLGTGSIKDAFYNIKILGKIFKREKEAENLIRKNREYLEILKKKISKIPLSKRKRVVRIMGRKRLRTPGDDSFQNEYINLAGGIAPKFGRNGNIIDVSKKEWKKFNPQVIYGCGDDLDHIKILLKDSIRPDVKIIRFPCVLTCRASTNIGYFASLLAAKIYPEEFGSSQNLVLKEEVYKKIPVKTDLNCIENANVKYSHIYDFPNQTLVINFKNKGSIVSTLEGFRKNIKTVGNHYFPAQTWGFGHKDGLTNLRKRVYKAVGIKPNESSFLFTGARISNISVQSQKYKKFKVYAFVTAGVRGNAQRMSKDTGFFYKPGTINIILITNTRLSQKAMTRAMITATEAKTAALQDLDIRSTLQPEYKATGTGTDNIIVCEGEGIKIDSTGGHTKMGELIAKAVYHGVKEAVYKQNGIFSGRNIFHRLKERNLSVGKIVNSVDCGCVKNKGKLFKEFEKVLLNKRYSSFLETAFAVSDSYEAGLYKNTNFFKGICIEISSEIAGKRIHSLNFKRNKKIPLILDMSLSAILKGLNERGL